MVHVTGQNSWKITKVWALKGSVNATNICETAKLSTVNGEVKADFDRLESGSKISLETVNGSVNLVIPSDSSATLRADSLNGNISNDFGLPVRKGKYIGRDLYGRLGAGDVQIRLNSVNGALTMSRKNDGKTPSPAVNLLQQKDKDDSDWDNDKDDDSLFQSEKVAKEIAKADKEIAKVVKASAKTTANISADVAGRGLADAERELNRLKPEIARITAESVAVAADAVANTAQIMRSDEMQQKMKEAQILQREAMNRNMDYSFFSSVARVEKKSESFPVKGTPKVTVNATGCSVTIRGWDKSEVQYRVTQFADSRSRKPLNIKQDHNDTSVTLNVENVDARSGAFFNGSIPVRIEVFVPRKSNLKIKSDGEIRLDGVSGEVELSGEDESINVRDVDGKLKLINTDGRVRIIGFKGELDSRTGDGDIYLEGDFSKIVARGGDGSYHLTVPSDPNLDIHANIEALTIENLRVPATVTEGHWRFGSGGADYTFKMNDGCVYVRSSASLSN